jgi:hypothetical protein
MLLLTGTPVGNSPSLYTLPPLPMSWSRHGPLAVVLKRELRKAANQTLVKITQLVIADSGFELLQDGQFYSRGLEEMASLTTKTRNLGN